MLPKCLPAKLVNEKKTVALQHSTLLPKEKLETLYLLAGQLYLLTGPALLLSPGLPLFEDEIIGEHLWSSITVRLLPLLCPAEMDQPWPKF